MAREDTDPKSSASAAAVPYVFFSFLLEVLLQFLVLVFALDMLDSISYMQLAILSALDMFSYSLYMKMLFTFSLSNRMAYFITTILVMLYLVFLLIKSLVNCSYFQQMVYPNANQAFTHLPNGMNVNTNSVMVPPGFAQTDNTVCATSIPSNNTATTAVDSSDPEQRHLVRTIELY